MKHNMFAWVEIPVNDMDRAIRFYEAVFDKKLTKVDFGGLLMAWFPHADDLPGASGTLINKESYVPSNEGSLVYFASEDVQIELDRIVKNGGTIMQSKKMISPEHGYMALIGDTEGNRIALYSKK